MHPAIYRLDAFAPNFPRFPLAKQAKVYYYMSWMALVGRPREYLSKSGTDCNSCSRLKKIPHELKKPHRLHRCPGVFSVIVSESQLLLDETRALCLLKRVSSYLPARLPLSAGRAFCCGPVAGTAARSGWGAVAGTDCNSGKGSRSSILARM